FVEVREAELLDERADAAPSHADPFDARDDPPQRGDRRRLAVRSREGCGYDIARMPIEQVLSEKRAHRVSEQDDGQARVRICDVAVQSMQIADRLAPAALVCEVAE